MNEFLEQIENHITTPLLFEGQSIESFKSIPFDEFLKTVFFKMNQNYITVYKNGIMQCHRNKLRSLSNIYRICKTYYPELTIEKFFIIFMENVNIETGSWSSHGSYFCGHICDEIGKRVWTSKVQEPSYGLCNVNGVDEYDMTLVQYDKFYKKLLEKNAD